LHFLLPCHRSVKHALAKFWICSILKLVVHAARVWHLHEYTILV
jgi:hypothetical protein